MAADKQQRLSSWIDNQVDDAISDDMIDALLEDQELQDTYSRYQLIGDAIRGEMPPAIDIDLTSRVAAALEDEPTILAPKSEPSAAVQPGKVVPLFKQLGQYAIAATVAAVAVLGVQQYNQPGNSEIPTPVLNTTPLTGLAAPVSLSAAPVEAEPSDEAKAQQMRIIEQRRRINAYLQDHEQQRRLQPMEQLDPADELATDTDKGSEER
ncbi:MULTISPECIES: sigma-E factor negative regulatory protein [Corallincola]|uniref:Anti-sigma-E factor RseA n=2 Tax=Corallincola TaxID=1775176 RepID=A0A368NQ92_9GAMM|nr:MULTISPECIES: anti sigma-E factor RseA C-terminal domain-containing protein [Corallincola]RCU51854.1 anti-sigma factor [Corallincola holothuriorum]TAA47344.1 anti-sigma factor [Corallincola spongiicola]